MTDAAPARPLAPTADAGSGWRPDTVLKADIFGQVTLGRYRGAPAILRDLGRARLWAWPIAAWLFRHEVRALQRLGGLGGVPQLLGREPRRLYRSWIAGVPLHVARPERDAAYFRSAMALLRALHRRGIAHNDLAKEPNWLRRPDGEAGLIDFQLATIHRRRGRLFRLLAYEDLRHLLKHKRRYCPEALTACERRVLARKTLWTRALMATVKPLYNGVTRGLFRWSDAEGTGERLKRVGPRLAERLTAHRAIHEAALAAYPVPGHGEGIYAFVVASEPLSASEVRAWARDALGRRGEPDLVQLVERLPRDRQGAVRHDILDRIAGNLVADLDRLVEGDAALAAATRAIVAGRLNYSDRRFSEREPGGEPAGDPGRYPLRRRGRRGGRRASPPAA